MNPRPLPYQGSALPLSYIGRINSGRSRSWSGRRGSNSRPSAWKADALSTELLPHNSGFSGIETLIVEKTPTRGFKSGPRFGSVDVWAKMDSNHRRYKPADLQSAPFGHSGIRPWSVIEFLVYSLSEPLVGFEPTTPRLQITCSGQLS